MILKKIQWHRCKRFCFINVNGSARIKILMSLLNVLEISKVRQNNASIYYLTLQLLLSAQSHGQYLNHFPKRISLQVTETQNTQMLQETDGSCWADSRPASVGMSCLPAAIARQLSHGQQDASYSMLPLQRWHETGSLKTPLSVHG